MRHLYIADVLKMELNEYLSKMSGRISFNIYKTLLFFSAESKLTMQI